MAFGLVSNNGTHNYNYQEFVCDTPADISKLPKDSAPGSTAFVVSTSEVYMMNTERTWILI